MELFNFGTSRGPSVYTLDFRLHQSQKSIGMKSRDRDDHETEM